MQLTPEQVKRIEINRLKGVAILQKYHCDVGLKQRSKGETKREGTRRIFIIRTKCKQQASSAGHSRFRHVSDYCFQTARAAASPRLTTRQIL